MALVVEALWDDEASVWVATSHDIPGLVTEADTLDELRSKLADIVPELLAENDPSTLRDWPLPIEIVARQRISIAAARWSAISAPRSDAASAPPVAFSSARQKAITNSGIARSPNVRSSSTARSSRVILPTPS